MASKSNHVHKYHRVRLGDKHMVWACALPGCTHYMPSHMDNMMPNKKSRCWGVTCDEEFLLNYESLKMVQPLCDKCRIESDEFNRRLELGQIRVASIQSPIPSKYETPQQSPNQSIQSPQQSEDEIPDAFRPDYIPSQSESESVQSSQVGPESLEIEIKREIKPEDVVTAGDLGEPAVEIKMCIHCGKRPATMTTAKNRDTPTACFPCWMNL